MKNTKTTIKKLKTYHVEYDMTTKCSQKIDAESPEEAKKLLVKYLDHFNVLHNRKISIKFIKITPENNEKRYTKRTA